MYLYFLGSQSNIATKREEDPTVIQTEQMAIREIEMWLDKYRIDLDFFVQTILEITKSFIIKISIEDTRILRLELQDDTEAFVELIDGETAKCKIITGENEYVYSYKDNFLLESIYEIVDGIKVGANIVEKQILLGKDKIFLNFEFEDYYDYFYEIIKSSVDKLMIWDNIASIICWMHDLPIYVPEYNVTIVSNDEGYSGVNKVYVIHNRIFRYVHINLYGEYIVDCDGVWEAIHLGYSYKFFPYDNNIFICMPGRSIAHLIMAHQYLSTIKELIQTMFGTINVINNSFDETEQLKT